MGLPYRDRRKHPRYKVHKNILSLSQDILAEVIDISRSGMSCQCLINTDIPLTAVNEIELLNCELGTSLACIPCRVVRSCKVNIFDSQSSTMIMHFGLAFNNLSAMQEEQIDLFIQDNSLREAHGFSP
ncbi:MAG: PilZ domain-containing protein [Desulfocapsaceae bacterium]|nr:PilZ domain-containing protein [Desulfocapsaceae bacterium]